MKKIFTIIFYLFVTSCAELASINIINSMLTPASILVSATNYGLDRYTGKQGSEHVLSLVTGQDCKFKFDVKNICTKLNYFY